MSMTQESGYPYDSVPSAFTPSTVGADSSFVISADAHGKGMNPKTWLVIVFVLFLLLSFVITIIVIQR